MKFVTSLFLKKKTSRERPKSAPYLRLKNSKRTSKCQVLSSTVPKKISKSFLNFFEVSGKSHCTEKCKRGPFGCFSTSILLQNRKKMKGGLFGDLKKIEKKSLTKPKKIYTKKFGQVRDSNPCPSAWQTSKSRILYASVV